MNEAHPLTSLMVVRSLNVKKDSFRPCEKGEELLGPEVPYLSAIGDLMYLATCTHRDIAFPVNLLTRYSSAPTRRHWNGIKHILLYLKGTSDMGALLFKIIKATTSWICRCRVSFRPTKSSIPNWVCI